MDSIIGYALGTLAGLGILGLLVVAFEISESIFGNPFDEDDDE